MTKNGIYGEWGVLYYNETYIYNKAYDFFSGHFFFFPVTVSSLFVLCIQYYLRAAYRYDSQSVIHTTFLNSI